MGFEAVADGDEGWEPGLEATDTGTSGERHPGVKSQMRDPEEFWGIDRRWHNWGELFFGQA